MFLHPDFFLSLFIKIRYIILYYNIKKVFKMKTANSEILLSGELHKHSIMRAYANIPTDLLKIAAQKMREKLDWYGGDSTQYLIYNCMIEVIQIVESDFKTEFVPQN